MTWLLVIAGVWVLVALLGALLMAGMIRSAERWQADPAPRPLRALEAEWADDFAGSPSRPERDQFPVPAVRAPV